MPSLNTLLNKSKGVPTANQLRNQGDEARDARNWAGATDAYQRYLEAVPGDGGIWVQYGHSLKEQGKLEEAVTAYEKGAGLQVGDADVRLHLAHLLKRLDRPRQAAAAFRTAMELTPTPEILSELKSLGYESSAQVSVDRQSGKAVKHGRYIELKDLFQYLGLHTTVTGITRVTLGLLHHILEEMDEERAASYQFVHMYGDAEGLLQLPKQQVRRIVRMAMSATPDLSLMQNMIGELRQRSPFARLKAGDLYMIVGAFWEFEANPAWLGGMKQRGVIIGAYIYDLIPITHAHYCMAALTNAFTAAFADTSRLLDFSLTISEFVAHQVKDYIKLHGIEPFPTKAVPLAHELRFASELMAAEESEGSTVLDVLDGRRFVLCVCTIEARKNHIYLFYIWQRMIDAGIPVPDLVFVGRQGWRVQDLLGQIEASSNLGGHLHIMHGLSDADLTTLYDHCMFTVFPSFVEGWGLPVGESLAHGKVCVASSSTSIPEVGGDFAAYVDPFNLESGYQEIRRLVTDPDHLAQLETRIRNGFKTRGWKDVGKDFFAGLDEVLDQRKRQPERPLYAPDLSSGSLLNVADLTNVGARGVGYVRNPQRLVLAEGWRSAEASGTWMLDPVAKLRFHTDIGPGRPVTILLQIGTSPWVNQTNRLRIRVANAEPVDFDDRGGYSKPMEPDRRFLARITGASDDAGYVSVQLKIDGAIRTSDKQAIVVGLRLFAVGYVASDDYLARICLLEEVILQPS